MKYNLPQLAAISKIVSAVAMLITVICLIIATCNMNRSIKETEAAIERTKQIQHKLDSINHSKNLLQ